MGYPEVRKAIASAGASMRCATLVKHLESLGFVVRDGTKIGHKVFKHPTIASFFGSNFCCGHGKNPEVLRGYLNKIIKVLDELEEELEDYGKRK